MLIKILDKLPAHQRIGVVKLVVNYYLQGEPARWLYFSNFGPPGGAGGLHLSFVEPLVKLMIEAGVDPNNWPPQLEIFRTI